MIYTSYYDSEKLDKAIDDGRIVVSISRSEPKWLEVDAKFWQLAPSYDLFNDSKKGISDEELEERYFKQLEEKREYVLEILRFLDKQDAILCCWCEDYSYCHRSYLAKWAKKYNFDIKEL